MMISSFLILIMSILGSQIKEGTCQTLDGLDLDPKNFKYHVSIIGNYTHTCGGGIIDENHVITAAHCVDNFEARELFVIVGVKYLHDPESISRNVRKIYVPADYYGTRRSLLDVAMLRLQMPLILGEKIGPITLPIVPVSPDNGTICSIAGLEKRTQESDRYRGKLSWMELMLIPKEVCKCMLEAQVYPNTLCATSIEENEGTPGDSGGILVCDEVAVGILKGGLQHVYIFSRIYDFKNFIKTVIRAP